MPIAQGKAAERNCKKGLDASQLGDPLRAADICGSPRPHPPVGQRSHTEATDHAGWPIPRRLEGRRRARHDRP